ALPCPFGLPSRDNTAVRATREFGPRPRQGFSLQPEEPKGVSHVAVHIRFVLASPLRGPGCRAGCRLCRLRRGPRPPAEARPATHRSAEAVPAEALHADPRTTA